MADQGLERAKKRLNSESFQKLTEHVKYEDLSAKQRELADVIGVEATLKLCEALGGKSVYIPGSLWFDRQEQDRRIREDFDSGASMQQLRNRYGVSDSQIRRAVRSEPAKMPKALRTLVEIISMEKTRRLCSNVGTLGMQGYMPKNEALKIWLRNLEIHEAFYGQGRSAAQIAENFDLSERAVQTLINTRAEDLNPAHNRRKKHETLE